MSPARNKRGASLPDAPYAKIARAVLGPRYELSVVAVSPRKARELNKKYRKKGYTPDVLAFPLGKNEGEIVLNASGIKREAKRHGMRTADFAAYIFMHACIHLKGHEHGVAMDRKERQLSKKLGIKTPAHH